MRSEQLKRKGTAAGLSGAFGWYALSRLTLRWSERIFATKAPRAKHAARICGREGARRERERGLSRRVPLLDLCNNLVKDRAILHWDRAGGRVASAHLCFGGE